MFGCLVAGRLIQTQLQQVEEAKWILPIPGARVINHLAVFLLGTIPLPEGTAATVYLEWPGQPWVFLGVVTNEKPSAFFRLRGAVPPLPEGSMHTMGEEEAAAIIGISIEPASAVPAPRPNPPPVSASTALVPANGQGSVQAVTMALMKHLYDYAASFVTTSPAPEDVERGGWIPTRVFQEWFKVVGRKAQANPQFLQGLANE